MKTLDWRCLGMRSLGVDVPWSDGFRVWFAGRNLAEVCRDGKNCLSGAETTNPGMGEGAKSLET